MMPFCLKKFSMNRNEKLKKSSPYKQTNKKGKRNNFIKMMTLQILYSSTTTQ